MKKIQAALLITGRNARASILSVKINNLGTGSIRRRQTIYMTYDYLAAMIHV